MPARSIRLAVLCTLSTLCAHPGFALETAEEIEACMDANLPGDTSIQTIRMTTYDRVEATTEMRAKMYWAEEQELAKVFMDFDAPPDLRGAALLMLEKPERNDVFMYLPELKKVKRVSSHMMSGSMFGSDFSYEEFERLQGMADNATSTRAEDEEVGGRPAYVLDQVPAEDSDSDYELVRSFIDHETCVLLQVEFYRPGRQLKKRLVADFASVKKESSGYFARAMTMHNLVEQTRTELAIDEIEIGVPIPRKVFSQAQLSRAGR